MATTEPRFLKTVEIQGETYERGTPVPEGLIKDHRIRQMVEARYIEMVPVDDGIDAGDLFELQKENEELKRDKTRLENELLQLQIAAEAEARDRKNQRTTEPAADAPVHLG